MKRIFILSIIIFSAIQSNACPICGCGVGGFYVGLLPSFNSKFIGMRYQYMRYETHITADASQFSHDHYKVAELWGGWTIGNKWQVLAFVPYHFNYQNTDDGIKTKNGLGDITLLANYKLWESSKQNKNDKSMSHQEFWLGGGIKLPPVKYDVYLSDPETELGDVNSQMGTGSLDFIASAMYNVAFNKIGINTSANYKINSANNSNFKFGNRFTANSFAFYQTHVSKTNLAPNIGVLYENAAINHLNKSSVEQTGGNVALAAAGLEINRGNVTVGANVQLPFSQNFAEGQTEAKTRGLIHATLTF
jgi:hypothetical protein